MVVTPGWRQWPGPDDLPPTCVYLVRHGRTALNAAGVLRGRLDPPLDDVGRRQVAVLGAALAGRGISRVVASPLRRTVDTAAAVGAACGQPVHVDPRLIDRDYGSWAGRRKEDVESAWGSVDAAPGVEPADEVGARAMAALADVAREAAGGTAAVVSHDIVIRLCLAACDRRLGNPGQLPQEPGRFNVLELRAGRWHVLGVNEDPSTSPFVTPRGGADRLGTPGGPER